MMMQSRIAVTLIATIGTNSSLVQATACSSPGRYDSTCKLPKQQDPFAWCGPHRQCCPPVFDVDCGQFVNLEYYQESPDGCWIGAGSCAGDTFDSCNFDNCYRTFALTGKGTPTQPDYTNIPTDAGKVLFDINGCPKCNLYKDQTDQEQSLTKGLPRSVQLKVPKGQCVTVGHPTNKTIIHSICPASYKPHPGNHCSKDYPKRGHHCCLDGNCGSTCDSPWTKAPDGQCVCPDPNHLVNGECKACDGPDFHTIDGKCVPCSGDYYVKDGQCTTKPNCTDHSSFNAESDKCECDNGYTKKDGKCVKGSGPRPDGPKPDDPSDDKNKSSFPLWLLILIIVLAVLAALIATWIIYRCCKKEPESDIKDQSSEGVYGERGSFVAASANSEMQIMTGIACAEGAKTHISAVDPNWSPSDDSITARRTTPNPDRSNVIRQGQVVEYV